MKDEKEASYMKNDVKLWKWMVSYARYTYKKPYVPIILSLLLFLVLSVWLFVGYGVHPYANTNYYRWSGDEITNRWDSYVGGAQNTYSSFLNMLGTLIPLPGQFQLTQMGCVIYERTGQNILEVECLQEIWKTEDEMHATPGWSDYCFKVPMDGMPSFVQDLIRSLIEKMKNRLSALEEDTKCIAFKSIITDFKTYLKTEKNISKPTYTDLTQEVLDDVMDGPDGVRIITTYLGNDYNPKTRSTTRLRSMFPFGLPLNGYKNKADRQSEQEDKMGKWQIDFLKPVDKMLKNEPLGIRSFQGFPFAMKYLIADLILKQVWWLVGSFSFLFVFSVIVMRSFFTSILGVIGVFLPIPCALACLNGIFQIHHIDAIDVIGLFLICGIGADCLFIIFELFRHARSIFGKDNEMRLAYAGQRGLIALSTSISTSAVTFIALCTSGVRIMNFFGIFCFLMLLFTFIFTFTFYLGIMAIWARNWEKTPAASESDDALMSMLESKESFNDEMIDYPYDSCFKCLIRLPSFNINAASMSTKNMNWYERFFYNYVSPLVYHYRLPIVLLFFVWSVIFTGLSFRINTKSELTFLAPEHHLQRAYSLALNGFQTALNDFSFVYVWGLKDKPKVPFKHRQTIDQYGLPEYKEFNITDPAVQLHLNRTWDLIRAETGLIDPITTENFGCSPWDTWEWIFNFDSQINPWAKFLFEWLNISEFPTGVPINQSQYDFWKFAWQAVLSEYAYEEPDSYVPGTLKANTIGFNPDNYQLRYIAMKANMRIPTEITVESLRELYKKAEKLANKIESMAPDGFEGWHTSVAWLTMVTEEELPKQIVKDVAIAFACGAIVIFVSTLSFLYTIMVIYCMLCVVFLILGCLALANWEIGTNEAIMISIASGFCADFIIQPMLALAHDFTKRPLFGKIQASLTTFCTPVTCAMITTLVAAAFLYPCEVMLFPPFATFLIGSGVFGILHGFIVLPALIGLFAPRDKSGAKFVTLYTANQDSSTAMTPELESSPSVQTN